MGFGRGMSSEFVLILHPAPVPSLCTFPPTVQRPARIRTSMWGSSEFVQCAPRLFFWLSFQPILLNKPIQVRQNTVSLFYSYLGPSNSARVTSCPHFFLHSSFLPFVSYSFGEPPSFLRAGCVHATCDAFFMVLFFITLFSFLVLIPFPWSFVSRYVYSSMFMFCIFFSAFLRFHLLLLSFCRGLNVCAPTLHIVAFHLFSCSRSRAMQCLGQCSQHTILVT
ncbi:hypothetical protein B0H14DRAFT_714988 [Mycena olivaceomarginata]|nr:hypothetical protein B0H14DRAFT_714988 [Mycena olivaceomarginata]